MDVRKKKKKKQIAISGIYTSLVWMNSIGDETRWIQVWCNQEFIWKTIFQTQNWTNQFFAHGPITPFFDTLQCCETGKDKN